MKITDIQIERYGVWNHLALPLPSAGLNVFYGPNEAGKTTLLRFIRDVLYGTSIRKTAANGALPAFWNGALRISHEDRFCEIRRGVDPNGKPRLEFQELDPASAWNSEPDWTPAQPAAFDGTAKEGEDAEEALAPLLAETPASLFEHVFAIGLNELQELATLHDEEVARQIYGLSLGWEGRTLLQISKEQASLGRQREFSPEIGEQIDRLMKRDQEIRWELEQYAGQRERHRHLLAEREALESDVRKLDSRQAELQKQLHGHEAVKRVWEPWNQVRECEAELQKLPAENSLAGMNPDRLTQWENEIRELRRERKSVIAEIKRLRAEWRSTKKDSSQQELAAELQSFLGEREQIVQVERELELASDRARELKTEFEARLEALGPDWPAHRLTAVDTSRSAYTRMVDAARGFQSAESRQASLRKRYEKHAAACHQRQTELDEQIEQLPEGSLDEALETTREQLQQAEELGRLKIKEKEIARQLAVEKRDRTRLEDRSQVPKWVPGFLIFLAVSGLMLSGLGFYTGLTSNGITGAILGLVGLAGFAIARAFQLQTHREGDDEHAGTESEIHRHEDQLHEIRSAIERTTPEAWVVTTDEAEIPHEDGENVLAGKLSERLAELKTIRKRQRRLHARRRRLSRVRKAMQNRQRDVAQARQTWCDVLRSVGLEETLPVAEAFEIWQRVTETMEHKRVWEAARKSADDVQNRHETFCRRLAEFGKRSNYPNLDYNQPLDVLDLWQDEFEMRDGDSQESSAIKRDYRKAKKNANRLKEQIFKARAARSAFLAQAGASNREDFKRKLESAGRRRELNEWLELAKAELAENSRDHADLAIVEDDLVNYDPQETQEAIDLLQMEWEELQTQSNEAVHGLEQVERELTELETDRHPAELRFERDEITRRLRECLEKHAAERLAANTVQKIRGEFERTCQPELLETASDYLAQLTCGKYETIWTKLDEQCLRLTDADGQTFTVEELSSGTREQLFLALRLGLVNEYANRGIELPMILDDVLVNFDQSRTEAAIQTLIEFTDRGHQVFLLTGNVHVAHMCEHQGIDPVWLPSHHVAVEHRRAG